MPATFPGYEQAKPVLDGCTGQQNVGTDEGLSLPPWSMAKRLLGLSLATLFEVSVPCLSTCSASGAGSASGADSASACEPPS
mmetsp:Transcript_101849/g.296980  ORF Transcript_101849/g.296980 Transcript_101849/m.296980 type:complete len:82 (+) Transcript_101849:287-532(+)